jgi:hypothetical protein
MMQIRIREVLGLITGADSDCPLMLTDRLAHIQVTTGRLCQSGHCPHRNSPFAISLGDIHGKPLCVSLNEPTDKAAFDARPRRRNYFVFICGAGVEPSPLLLRPFIGLLYQPWMIHDDDCGAIGEMNEW